MLVSSWSVSRQSPFPSRCLLFLFTLNFQSGSFLCLLLLVNRSYSPSGYHKLLVVVRFFFILSLNEYLLSTFYILGVMVSDFKTDIQRGKLEPRGAHMGEVHTWGSTTSKCFIQLLRDWGGARKGSLEGSWICQRPMRTDPGPQAGRLWNTRLACHLTGHITWGLLSLGRRDSPESAYNCPSQTPQLLKGANCVMASTLP